MTGHYRRKDYELEVIPIATTENEIQWEKRWGKKKPHKQTEAQQAMAQVQELVAAGTSGNGVNIETKNKVLDLIESQFTKALGSTSKRKTTQLKPLHGSQPCCGAEACKL